MKCPLCWREGAPDLCQYHLGAKERVEEGFQAWRRAYGGIDWKDYLDNIKRREQTGQWAKEIVELLERRA